MENKDLLWNIHSYNVHKTFSTPHGGGGPGAGPIAVLGSLSGFLPIPKIVFKNDNLTILPLNNVGGNITSLTIHPTLKETILITTASGNLLQIQLP